WVADGAEGANGAEGAGGDLPHGPGEVAGSVDPAVAYLLTDMLRDVLEGGTGSAVRATGYRGPA
ncbi:MAG: hypothetical protein GWM90_15625, partial [Gemmatimonadetes bacterium]|nr:hypothetical protein [Gemmatimonadota bacterium]NIQ55645.1 hypothetical protein [Gemmatimonadota bacterium]NIU75848.1 hypothetical protein [Gammaproteobacteria bacterium]NIX45480.1 hypothetical protein [Gemmatimonadota bacterium]NIY09762.1 hypothetical protein [Gemmatimonadota bacterium]